VFHSVYLGVPEGDCIPSLKSQRTRKWFPGYLLWLQWCVCQSWCWPSHATRVSSRSHLTVHRTIGLMDYYRTISDGLMSWRTRVRHRRRVRVR